MAKQTIEQNIPNQTYASIFFRKLKRFNTSHAAIVLTAIGLPILFLIGAVSKPAVVPLDRLLEYEGEQVTVEGIVIDSSMSKLGGLTITLYSDGTTVPVFIEVSSKTVAIHDRVRVTGEVMRFKSSLEVTAPNDNTLEQIGRWEERFILVADADTHIGEYVTIEGTVIDITSIGGGRAILELRDADSTLTVFLKKGFAYDEQNATVRIGDMIRTTGMLDLYDNNPELIVYSATVVTVTAPWSGSVLALKTIGLRPWDYEFKPLEVEGYIENEPYRFQNSLSFTLVDDLLNPVTGLKVKNVNSSTVYVVNTTLKTSPHKGDYIRVAGRLSYDPDLFQFVFDCQLDPLLYGMNEYQMVVINEYGTWYIALTELAKDPYSYERAIVNVPGFVTAASTDGDNWTVMIADDLQIQNRSTELLVRINNATMQTIPDQSLQIGEQVRVAGRFIYFPEQMRYGLEIDPSTGGIWRRA